MSDIPPSDLPDTGDVAAYGAQILDNLGDKVAEPDPYADEISHAWQLHQDNKNEQAVAEFDRILQQDPEHMDALYGKGLALKALGRKDDAVAAFEKVRVLIDGIRADMPGRSTILDRLTWMHMKWVQEE